MEKIKLSNKSIDGTSFHGDSIISSVKQLTELIGEAQHIYNDGSDKTNFDWVCELEDGNVFTLYDWKYYRPLDYEEEIVFYIGGFNGTITRLAKLELEKLLS